MLIVGRIPPLLTSPAPLGPGPPPGASAIAQPGGALGQRDQGVVGRPYTSAICGSVRTYQPNCGVRPVLPVRSARSRSMWSMRCT